jgi:hypothetical protein
MLGELFRRSNSSFRTRSSERDDRQVTTIVQQIEAALMHATQEIEAQKEGLRRRLNAVITRAAVIGGNDIDEALTRDEADAADLAASDVEISRAESRLNSLEEQLSHFTFLKSELHARFPLSRSSISG